MHNTLSVVAEFVQSLMQKQLSPKISLAKFNVFQMDMKKPGLLTAFGSIEHSAYDLIKSEHTYCQSMKISLFLIIMASVLSFLS